MTRYNNLGQAPSVPSSAASPQSILNIRAACPGYASCSHLFDGSRPGKPLTLFKRTATHPPRRFVGGVCLPTTTHFKRRTQMFGNQNVSASEVLSTRDMNVRPGRDVTEIVGTFLTVAEAVVTNWVEYSKGLLLFVIVPGPKRSREFYIIYDRRKR